MVKVTDLADVSDTDITRSSIGCLASGQGWKTYAKNNILVPGVYKITWRTKNGDKSDWVALNRDDIAYGFVLTPYERDGKWRIRKIKNVYAERSKENRA